MRAGGQDAREWGDATRRTAKRKVHEGTADSTNVGRSLSRRLTKGQGRGLSKERKALAVDASFARSSTRNQGMGLEGGLCGVPVR